MKLVRLGLSSVFGIVITFGLLMLMYTLIASNAELEEKEEVEPLADIFQADEQIDDNLKKFNIKQPEPKVAPPPRMSQEESKADDVNLSMQMETPRMDSGLSIGSGGFGGSAGGRPLKRVAPKYPSRAEERGIEGYCTVEFTVTAEGNVVNPVVIEGMITKEGQEPKPTTIFNNESVRAAKKMKFKPQMEDNVAVEYITTYRFVFEFDEDE